ncbi:hypothetical protein D3C76_1605700 [compost metagenome]
MSINFSPGPRWADLLGNTEWAATLAQSNFLEIAHHHVAFGIRPIHSKHFDRVDFVVMLPGRDLPVHAEVGQVDEMIFRRAEQRQFCARVVRVAPDTKIAVIAGAIG